MPRSRWSLDLSPLRPPTPGVDWLKAGFAVGAALYLGRSMADPEAGNLLGGIVFYTHEAGHVIFGPFGTFPMFAGGTLMQLLVPVAFAATFLRQGQLYSAAVALLWLALSFADAARYAGDAIALEATLSGSWVSGQEELAEYGETRHDWHNMLDMLGILRATPLVAGVLRLAGWLTFAIAGYLSLLTAGVPLPYRFGGAEPRSVKRPRPRPPR